MWFKSIFDFFLAALLLTFFSPLWFTLFLCCSLNSREFGVLSQERIGQYGKPFVLYKFKTMRGEPQSTITTSDSPFLTPFGKVLRKYKLDEAPQLINIFIGKMSFVGPRPDVPGYANNLKGTDREMLLVKPGIFGPAQLKYRNEEYILSEQESPEQYNNQVLWPDKVRINCLYVQEWSFLKDVEIIIKTLRLVFFTKIGARLKQTEQEQQVKDM